MNATQRTNVKLSGNRANIVIEQNGRRVVVNANLIRYMLDVPYTRKDGTVVSSGEIFDMKSRAQQAYDQKIRLSAG